MRSTALIVGAGVGGLAAGIALRHAGWEVRVYERAASPRELGFGLLLAPNALAALNELGLADPILVAGAPTGQVEIRRRNGDLIRRLDAHFGGPSVVALRTTLHGTLLEAVGGEHLPLGLEVTGFADSGEAVTVQLGDGTSDSGALLVGADGVASVIRRQLHPGEAPPAPSGFCAIRGVAHDAAGFLGELSGVAYLDTGIEAATVRAGGTAVYWYVSLRAQDVRGTSPQDILSPWLRDFDHPFRSIVDATAAADVRFDRLFRRPPLPHWGAGRVTLLGDAAHPVMPHTGQGAAQALEDGVGLGLALRGAEVVQSLRAYERVRSRRTAAFVRLGPRIARVTTTTSPVIAALRNTALRLLPERVLARPAASLRGDPHRELRRPASGRGSL